MKRQRPIQFLPAVLGLTAVFALAALVIAQTEPRAFIPIVVQPYPTETPTSTPTPTPTPTATPTATPPPNAMVEMRAVWVSRFDWLGEYTPAKIDEIVNNVAYAGFNAIFFQVRGAADAFYDSNYEPWSQRLTGTLGQNPGWDPLAHMIQQAHARGIQVHAYINVYPVWLGCQPPPAGTNPPHLYYGIEQAHGTTGGKLNGLQWSSSGSVVCSSYLRSSPASVYVDDHLLNVAKDLVTRYDIDGLHLDHIRYDGPATSCDPVSESSAGVPCFSTPPAGYGSWQSWQRAQVNGTVWKFYTQIVPLKPDLWLSAAVWPIYYDYWNWGIRTGYSDYYQDSKSWIGFYDGTAYIDSISPMIYPASFNCPDDSFWTLSRWQLLVQDFQSSSNVTGRYIIPGIGTGYCSFAEIENRINIARTAGTAGHALFSYGGLLANGYFDDLANGPYATPAVVPGLPWRNELQLQPQQLQPNREKQ